MAKDKKWIQKAIKKPGALRESFYIFTQSVNRVRTSQKTSQHTSI